MWVLIILAIHVNDPEDIPGKVQLQFQSLQECQQAQSTISYNLKFKSFKVISECKQF